MSARKEISNQIRYLIISDCRDRSSCRVIAKKFGVSKSAVEKIYKKYLVHKYTIVENLSGRGRKRCTTTKEDRRIIHKCRQNPRIASRNIVGTLELNVSSKTVRHRLQELGLRYCKAKRKPYINQTKMK